MTTGSSTNSSILNELHEAQKARNDLMKWKLLIVAVVGSFGLGFLNSTSSSNLYLVILVIPFSCVYVDLLCRDLSIKTKLISKFIAGLPDPNDENIDTQYHKYYRDFKKGLGASFETYALRVSTVLLTLSITVLGCLVSNHTEIRVLFIISGVINLAFCFLVERKYSTQRKKLSTTI